ncbi:MAG: S8 family serine peptidase [Caldilinea sp.]|nr:S8 family serine peptidase [Caldilinea sp.]MDW8442547.1 S8 family serine peptidase [Caldilineaceae bacterium]
MLAIATAEIATSLCKFEDFSANVSNMAFNSRSSTIANCSRGMALWLWGTFAFALFLGGFSAAWAQSVDPAASDQSKIVSALVEELRGSGEGASFLVILNEQMDPQQIVATAGAEDVVAKRAALYAALTEHARRTQAPLRAWLDAQGIPYTAHYLVNMLEVQGDLKLAQQLAQRPEVGRLARNPLVRGFEVFNPHRSAWSKRETLPVVSSSVSSSSASTTLPWGLLDANADDVWALGFRGQGIVVAGQDTGVVWDHPALQRSYRGWDPATMTATHVYNWFDAWGRDPNPDGACPSDPQIPCDDDLRTGHGTHTLGTVVGDATGMGDTVIGMAPDALWIACRNMRNGFGTPASYTACFEFFLAPFPQGGDPLTDGRPELAPHVINNSWGCPPQEGCDADSLRQVVETMRAAGIFVVASAGNEGSSCSTVRNPIGLHDAVTSVGAHASNGVIAFFSSRGPVTVDGSGRLKPDLTAPGVGVRSAGRLSNGWPTANLTLSGTSMAAPHVAGAVALLWSLDPTLIGKVEETEQILLDSATPAPSADCTGGELPQVPNPVYGHGRLDVLKAAQLVLADRVAIALEASPSRGGTLSGGGAVAPGTPVTVTATAAPGYTFINWTEGDVEVSTEPVYAFTALENRRLTANFRSPGRLWFPLISR